MMRRPCEKAESVFHGLSSEVLATFFENVSDNTQIAKDRMSVGLAFYGAA
jgi:hypothetical protein